MNNWHTLLKQGDPAADARLSPREAEIMRQAVLAAAREPREAPFRWHQPLAMAAILVLMVASGIVAGHRALVDDTPAAPPIVHRDDEPEERRQIQFSTPGGTRIIWTFDPEFNVTTP